MGWIKPFWRWLQHEQAKSWPTASGRIDSAFIDEPKRFLGLTLQSSRSRRFDAVLAYSYSISGTSFQGQFRRNFGLEEEAREFLRGLDGQTISVNYNSNNPARSTLLEATIDSLLRSRPPASPGAALGASYADSIPGWLKPFLGVFALLSLIGLILSLWVHIGAISGRRVAPEYFFWGLHMGIFVVFFPAILVAQRRVGSTNRKDFWKAATKGSPDGLRYLVYFFFAYAFINFAIFMAQAPTGKSVGEPPASVWRGFSGHWMVFYSASFAILFSALNSARTDQQPR